MAECNRIQLVWSVFFKLWHPRCVLITVYKEWYQVVKHSYIYLATQYHSLYTGMVWSIHGD
jgi:hypothetical protein